MGEWIGVRFVFEQTPTPPELADAVGEWRRTCRVSSSSTIDPDEQDDKQIAEALLTEDESYKYKLEIGYGGIRGTLWFYPTGLVGQRDEYEGVRKLPHAQFHIPNNHFYPATGESEAAVIERSEDFVTFVKRVYEGLAEHGVAPAYVYSPHPGTMEVLSDPESEMTFSEAEITEGVPSEVFMLQVYPPQMAEQIGVQKLLSAPAWHTDRLADGGVIVAVYETPTLYTAQGDGYVVERVADHIHGK